jgi:molybdopterin-guanine dinucleotide biosynthesis protein A
MGRDKATLPFGGETLLQRVVRLLAPAVEDVVVVARPGQDLPPLPAHVRVARDEVLDRGPLGGLVPGLAASRADAVYASACDVPYLKRAVVDLLFERLGANAVAVAEAEGYTHPLAAVYRTSVRPEVERLLAEGRLRPVHLYDLVPTVRVGEAELRAVDETLGTLANLNTPEAYEAALARRPLVRVELYETARRRAGLAEVEVEATTLGEALGELGRLHPALVPDVLAGGRLARHARASVNGRAFVEDPSTPLAKGDALLLISALAGG